MPSGTDLLHTWDEDLDILEKYIYIYIYSWELQSVVFAAAFFNPYMGVQCGYFTLILYYVTTCAHYFYVCAYLFICEIYLLMYICRLSVGCSNVSLSSLHHGLQSLQETPARGTPVP